MEQMKINFEVKFYFRESILGIKLVFKCMFRSKIYQKNYINLFII